MASLDPKDWSIETLDRGIDQTQKAMDEWTAQVKTLRTQACAMQDRINKQRIKLTALKRARTDLGKQQRQFDKRTKESVRKRQTPSKGPLAKRLCFDDEDSGASDEALDEENGAHDAADVDSQQEVDYESEPSTQPTGDSDGDDDGPETPQAGAKMPALHHSVEIPLISSAQK